MKNPLKDIPLTLHTSKGEKLVVNKRQVPPVALNEWIKMSERKPKQNQDVYYFFEHTGVHKGKYRKQELDERIFGKKGLMADVFFSEKGFLTDDVTHWMPVEATTVFPPDEPKIK